MSEPPSASAVVHVVGQRGAEGLLRVGQRDAVLWPLGTGERRDHRGQVELEPLGEARLGVGVVPETLLLGVGLDQGDLVVVAARHLEVLRGLLVDREDRDRGPELRAHVADRGPVGHRQRGDAGSVELHELADDAVLAEHLGDRQHQVGRGGSLGQVVVQLEADDVGDQHGDRLAEHGRLGLDAADAPADDADAVHHRGVRVGADQRVRVRRQLPVELTGEHHPCQVLDVDLVDDAGAGWDHLEVVERALAPAQELVALTVALVLDLDVALERLRRTEDVGDHGVVDHHLGGSERVDPRRVSAEVRHRLAHGGQVDDARHAGEVLHDHARRRELDLLVGVRLGVPAGQRLDVVGGDVLAVLGAEQVLQEHLEAEGQRLDVEAVPVDRIQAVDLVGLAVDVQRALGTKAVGARHDSPSVRGLDSSVICRVAHLAHARGAVGRKATLRSYILMSRYHGHLVVPPL